MAVQEKAPLESHYAGRITIGSRSFELDSLAGGGPNVNTQKTVLGSNASLTATQPGRRDFADVTFTLKVRASQGVEMERYLLGQVGADVTIVRYATDGNYTQTGAPLTYTGGVLSMVEPVSYDNESTTVAKISGTVVGARLQ